MIAITQTHSQSRKVIVTLPKYFTRFWMTPRMVIKLPISAASSLSVIPSSKSCPFSANGFAESCLFFLRRLSSKRLFLVYSQSYPPQWQREPHSSNSARRPKRRIWEKGGQIRQKLGNRWFGRCKRSPSGLSFYQVSSKSFKNSVFQFLKILLSYSQMGEKHPDTDWWEAWGQLENSRRLGRRCTGPLTASCGFWRNQTKESGWSEKTRWLSLSSCWFLSIS